MGELNKKWNHNLIRISRLQPLNIWTNAITKTFLNPRIFIVSSMAYTPSAPELPESFGQQIDEEARYTYAYPYSCSGQPTNQLGSCGMFSPETHPDIVRSFESAGGNRSGFLDESELRYALSFSGNEGISNRTIRFLLFIYKSPRESLLRLGKFSFLFILKIDFVLLILVWFGRNLF